MFLSKLLERQKNNTEVAIKQGECKITYKEWYNYSRQLSNVLKLLSKMFQLETLT